MLTILFKIESYPWIRIKLGQNSESGSQIQCIVFGTTTLSNYIFFRQLSTPYFSVSVKIFFKSKDSQQSLPERLDSVEVGHVQNPQTVLHRQLSQQNLAAEILQVRNLNKKI